MATLQTYIDQTRNLMNAYGSGQWTDAEITSYIGTAHWAEWADLLNANRFYKMQQVSVTEDSNGQFTFASLTTGSGDTAKYFYRIITVAQPGTPASQVQYYYREATYDQYPNPQPNTSLPYVWYRFGDNVQVLPVASGQGLTITTNWRPTKASSLTNASSTVDFPTGYEDVVSWRAAALALAKGGSEVDATRSLLAQYTIMHDAFLADLGRQSTWPIIARAFDVPQDWGGGFN